MKTKSFKDLIAWQKSYKLVLETYKLTKEFPKEETYGLAQQMRRSVVSIPSNIAEGYARQHRLEYKQFLSMAYGSLAELETQVMLAKDLSYVKDGKNVIVEDLMKEVGSILYRMLNPIR